MAFQEGFLVDADIRDGFFVPPREAARDRPLPYGLGLLPADAEERHGTRDVRRAKEHFDGKGLEKQRPARMRAGPRHGDGQDAMHPAGHARQAGDDLRPELHRVEVAPAALRRVVVERRGSPAVRAGECGVIAFHDMQVEGRVFDAEFDVPDDPRRHESEEEGIVVFEGWEVGMGFHPRMVSKNPGLGRGPLK